MGLGKFPHPQPDMGIPAVSYCYHGDGSRESIPDGDLPISILRRGGGGAKSAARKGAGTTIAWICVPTTHASPPWPHVMGYGATPTSAGSEVTRRT
jgi:hypothetical protein